MVIINILCLYSVQVESKKEETTDYFLLFCFLFQPKYQLIPISFFFNEKIEFSNGFCFTLFLNE